MARQKHTTAAETGEGDDIMTSEGATDRELSATTAETGEGDDNMTSEGATDRELSATTAVHNLNSSFYSTPQGRTLIA